jgi:hypothetical protein
MAFQRDNHYVPCLYLKRFALSNGRLWTYRILVAHSRVPFWKTAAIKGIAFHSHLYTRTVMGVESDDIEKWLNAEFESPAEEALSRATGNMRLSPNDWRNLIRFVAAQDVRTPARLQEDCRRWDKDLQSTLDDTLKDSVHQLELAKKSGKVLLTSKTTNSEYIPIRISTNREPGQKFGELKAEVIAGRGLWFFGMRHLLTKTIDVLLNQRWTILMAPDDLTWFTSDDPVVRVNYYGEGQYDFRGGWGKEGTEIFIALDSRHLLYTQVGCRPPERGSIVARSQAQTIRRLIAEHAHRFIFAASRHSEIVNWHPRTENAVLLRQEQERWQNWHEQQTAAERQLLRHTDATGEIDEA